MQAEALLDLKDINKRSKRRKRRHLQAVESSRHDFVTEKPKNTLRHIFIAFVFTCVVVLAGIYGAKSYAEVFAVEHVLIEGEYHNEQAINIENILRPYLKGSLFNINLPAAQNALTNIDWISNVQLQRAWPNKVIVKIQEHTPVARWNTDSYIDAEGNVFSVAYGIDPVSLPSVSGPPQRADAILKKLTELNSLLKVNNIRIKKLEVDDRNTWRLVTDDGVVYLLGGRNIESRLNRFFSAMKTIHAPELKQITSVDLRHSNGFAVKWYARQIKQHG